MKNNYRMNDIDPIVSMGNRVVVYRNKFPLHATITWNDIVPLWQLERNSDQLRMLRPYGPNVCKNHVEYEGESDYPEWAANIDRQEFMPTLVTHTRDNFNDKVNSIIQQEAVAPFNIQYANTYANVVAESYVLDSHNDPMSILIVQCIGQSQYSFDDGSIHTLDPGDGIYIPRTIYHKPRVFGPRYMHSYYWNTQR